MDDQSDGTRFGSSRGRPLSAIKPHSCASERVTSCACGCERIPLERIAKAVGVSPVYLTQEFTRSEGVPLYQYQLYLRLVRSLQQLRDCDDITQLALELGFYSHSHFGATFGRAFGLAPPEFR